MSYAINKVIVHKLGDVPSEFVATFNAALKTTRDLFNEMICWGKNSVHTYTGVVDLTVKRKDLYNKTDKSITYDQFQDLLFVMFNCLINESNNGRGFVSAILGNPRIEDLVTDYDELNKIANKFRELDSKEAKKFTKACGSSLPMQIGNSLKKVGYKNRSPYTNTISPIDKYGIVANCHRMLTSWVECDKSTYSNFHEEESEITKAKNEFSENEQDIIEQFVDFCLTPVDLKNPNSCIIKHFDTRMHNYIKNCVIPSLKNGEVPEKHFIINNKDEEIPYSLHHTFILYLQSHPELWSGDDPLILRSLFILEMEINHENHQEYAKFPFITEDNIPRFQYMLGDNYTSYKFDSVGEPVDDVQLSVTRYNDDVNYHFVNGIQIDSLGIKFKNRIKDIKDEEYNMKIYTNDLRHNGTYNPNPYFKDLNVWTTDTKKCTNLFQFTHKDETVQAIIKEPSIVYNGQYYAIRLNMTVVVDDNTLNNYAAWFLSTALPASKTKRANIKDTPKNIERINLLQGKTFNLLGIDLGQRTPYSYAVGQTTITGMSNDLTILTEGEFQQTDSKMSELYWHTFNVMKNTSKVIGITKSIKKQIDNNDVIDVKFHPFVITLIEQAQEYFQSTKHHHNFTTKKKNAFEKITNQTPAKILSDLIKQVQTHDIKDLKSNPNWIGMYLVKYCQLMFTKTKKERQYHLKENSVNTKHDYEFNWLKCIEQYKRVLRSSFYMGTDPENRTEINVESLNKYFNGVKDNFLKVIASNIVSTALENKCSIIVLEDLNNKKSKLNKRQENFMTSLWSPKRIQDAIKNAANWHGINVITVSESCTSRFHFESGKFGYRDGTTLYYEDDNGKIQTTHADMNAAKNILFNAVTRHASIRQVFIKNDFSNENVNKRVQGFLTYMYGNVNDGIKEIQSIVGEDSRFAYLHGDEWINGEQVKEIRNKIKSEVTDTK